jgi:hypothetical protein
MIRKALFFAAVTLGACAPDPGATPPDSPPGTNPPDVQPGDPNQSSTVEEAAVALTSDIAPLFDRPASNPARDGYRVVGAIQPPSWSWGEIELLEGQQTFRTEGYNYRTTKLRKTDTFQSSQYPVRTYFGDLNQSLVDGFNLYYRNACATGASACPSPGPTRPEARFVLLHKGPRTARRDCDASLTPVLLVHGALQDGNVWIAPAGNDGQGRGYGNPPSTAGFVSALEAARRCTYAVTFGSFHGDNYNQANSVANAIARIRAIHRVNGRSPRVDVVAWSKGVLSVDAYLGNAATWRGFSTRYFERVAAAHASRVVRYRDDVRVYVALSGPHLGIDLNFRHPIHTLTIPSTPDNAPIGRGPMAWTWFSALQCVNWGPDNPWFANPYAASVCQSRGGTWPDFFNRVYVSNLTGLDANGRPASSRSLRDLNVGEGVTASNYDFDEYNISLFGSVNDQGKWVSAYLGQLQATNDLRAQYPIPRRDDSAWSQIDQDEARWYPWIRPKLTYLGGGYLDDMTRTACRATAYDAARSPCVAWHTYLNTRNAESRGLYNKYQLFAGLGVDAAMEMGGRFIARLAGSSGLDARLPSLYVLYGTTAGSVADAVFETDGMPSPNGPTNGDGVLFNASIAAGSTLTRGWTAARRNADLRQEGVPLGHLEVGSNPMVWDRIIAHFRSRD